MKKRLFSLFFLMLSSIFIYSQTQLSFRYVNPRIVYTLNENADGGNGLECQNLLWDVEMKASVSDTRYSSITILQSYNAAALADFVYLPGTLGPGTSLLSRYDLSVNTNSGNLNVIISTNQTFTNATVSRYVLIPTTYTLVGTFMCRITDPTAIAGIDFIRSSMDGDQIEKLFSDPWEQLYMSPNAYEGYDLLNLNLGRVYSSSGITPYGWSQYGGTVLDTPYLDWSASVNTSIWEGNVILATADNTAALANNFSIHNDATLTIPANKWLTVAGTLTNPSVGSLTIESGGSLIHATNDVPATIKRDLTGNKYHQVSIPLTAAANPVSNLYLGSYLFGFTESGSTNGTWTNLGVSTTTPLDVDKGYMMYYPDAATLAVSYAGNMRNGTVSPPLSFTNAAHGFNLVPNPYPSAIDWTLLSKTNLADAIWIWNQNTTNYGAYGTEVGSGTSATTQFIPVGQAFFVRAESALPALTIENADRVHNAQAFAKSSTTVENILHLTATGNNSADEVIVAFNNNWSVGADNADVAKMFGSDGAPQLSCVTTDNNNLTINALPFGNGNVVVPLNFSLTANTDVTFEAKGIESFSTDLPIYLDDLMLSKVIDLRVQPSYTFNHTVGNAGNRFQLRFMGVTGTPEQLEAKGNVFMSNGKLFVDVPSMNQSEVTIGVYDALGRQLISNKMMVNGVTEITTPVATGVYIVRVIGGNKTFAGKVFVN